MLHGELSLEWPYRDIMQRTESTVECEFCQSEHLTAGNDL